MLIILTTVGIAWALIADALAREQGQTEVAREMATLRDQAEEKHAEAVRQRAIADLAKDQLGRIAYADRIALAQKNWGESNVARARILLAECAPRPGEKPFLEWGYLKRVMHSEKAVLHGHTDKVTHVAYSPDGRRLASASNDKTVRLWDTVSGKELAVLKGHTESVWHVSWSPDGLRLASAAAGGSDKTVRLWDATTCKELAALQGHTDLITDVTWSPDGRRLASASKDSTARLWDSATGKELAVFKSDDNGMRVTFSPDGHGRAVVQEDFMVRLCDITTGKELALLEDAGFFNHSAISPDRLRLALASSTSDEVCVWSTVTGKKLAILKGHANLIKPVVEP